MIRSGSQTFQISPAAGYPLVVLANGNETTWPPKYFSQNPAQKAIPRVAVGYRYYPG